jgi:DHA1 family multidrug resistance protein-like MFS transporter/DHA1 family quinolone resistance protein-like MFS transporter
MKNGTPKKGTRPGKMAVIIPAAFINSLAIGTMALYGASPALVGAFGAVWSTSYFLGCILLRRLVRRFRPRSSMAIMLGGSSTILMSFILWPGLMQAFVACALYGFITAFFWPPVMGWLSKGYEGAELNRATSLFSFSWSLGGIFSSYIAGLLSERGKFLPVIFAAVLFAIDAAYVLASRLFVEDEGFPGKPAANAAAAGIDRSTSLRYPAWLGAFLIYAVMGVMFNVFPVFARDELSISESSIGLVLTVRALATAFGFFALGRLTFWQFKRAALPILSAGTAATLTFLVFQRSPLGFALCFGLVGLLQSVMYNNSLFYATSGASDRDKRATVHEALVTLGQVIGSIAGGVLYQEFSMPVVFMGLALLTAAGAGIQVFMVAVPELRRSPPGQAAGS